MGSSGGGLPRAPNMPTPAGTQVPYGQTSPAIPQYTSFLPTDPNAMATGLTPEMLAAINAPPPPPPVMQAAAPAAAAAQQRFNPSLQAQFLLGMGADPRALLGQNYGKWASAPATRGELANVMGGSRLRGRNIGGSNRGSGNYGGGRR